MNRDAQSFTGNNHLRSWRSQVSHIHKPWWQKTHTFQKKLLKNSAVPIVITGDQIAAGFRIYRHVWRIFFEDSLNSGISGDRVANVLLRARDISLPHTTSFVIMNCNTNNVDQNKSKNIAPWNHKNCQNLYKETSNYKYHNYWHVTRRQDILFSAIHGSG